METRRIKYLPADQERQLYQNVARTRGGAIHKSDDGNKGKTILGKKKQKETDVYFQKINLSPIPSQEEIDQLMQPTNNPQSETFFPNQHLSSQNNDSILTQLSQPENNHMIFTENSENSQTTYEQNDNQQHSSQSSTSTYDQNIVSELPSNLDEEILQNPELIRNQNVNQMNVTNLPSNVFLLSQTDPKTRILLRYSSC